MNSRFLQDLQGTDAMEEKQVQLIGKQKTGQLSALDSCGVVLSMGSLLDCVQSFREVQLNESLGLGPLKHSMSELAGPSDNI